jgi:hypothetical protein
MYFLLLLFFIISGCTQLQHSLNETNESAPLEIQENITNITQSPQNITNITNTITKQNITNITNVTTYNVTIVQNISSSKQTSDFNPCSGIDLSEKERVAYHRILLAKSNDGLHFTRLNKIISDRASVPAMMIDSDGNLRIYFIQVACKEQNLRNAPVVAISYDQGQTWVYKRLNIEAPSEAPQCKEPGGNPPPVDPYVVLMKDGYRLYATCPKPSGTQQIPMTFVFFSNDGINFSNGKPTYVPAGGRALDPVVVRIGSQWHLFNGDEKGGVLHALSNDGITFTETAKFCPFKFTNIDGSQRCYMIGKGSLILDSSIRLYVFGNTPQEGFKSIVSSDGESWTMEQSGGEYVLSVQNSSFEYHEIASPTVVKLTDGSYLMAYETVIPGTPASILSGGQSIQQNYTVPKNQSPSQQNLPLQGDYCGDGRCSDIERQTGGCPQDC